MLEHLVERRCTVAQGWVSDEMPVDEIAVVVDPPPSTTGQTVEVNLEKYNICDCLQFIILCRYCSASFVSAAR